MHPEKDRRKAILAMMEVMSQSFASPMSLEVGPIEVTGDQADVALVMKLDPNFDAQGGVAGTAEGSEPEVAEYLTFAKKEAAWKFDGLTPSEPWSKWRSGWLQVPSRLRRSRT